MPGQDLVFYGTTGPGGTVDGQSQPDPELWLGRYRASQTLHEFQSTVTTAQTNQSRHYLIDSSRIGDGENAHALKWLVVLTGSAAPSAARIMAFRDADGTFKLDRPLSANAGAGDYYAIFDPEAVFPNVTEEQAAAGDVRYRCVAVRNQHGGAVTNVRIYFRDVSLAGSEFDRFHQAGASSNFLQRSDDETDLFNALGERDPAGGPDGFSGCGGWLHPFGYASADTEDASLAVNTNLAIWLRRTIRAGSRFRRSVAIQLVIETTTTGSDPDPLLGSAIIAFDVLPAETIAEVTPDRFVHVGGGTRLTGSVVSGDEPIVDRPVRWDVRAGDLGSIYTDDEPLSTYDETDADGDAFSTFISPESQAIAGETSHPRLIVGAGEEVGNPLPRITGALAGAISITVAATGHLPASSRSYLEDEAPRFLTGSP